MKRAMLFSGGLDSLCMWVLYGRPTPYYVLTGSRYTAAEVENLRRLQQVLPDLHVQLLDGPVLPEHDDGHVPVRNLTMAAVVLSNSNADQLLLGATLGEASPDKSRAFLRAASRAFTASEHRPVQLLAPLLHRTKTAAVRHAMAVVPRYGSVLTLTRSCYSGQRDYECGRCQACFRRNVALYHAGLLATPPQWPTAGPQQALAALRGTSPTRWPGMAWNNTLAAMAVAGIRLPQRTT